MRKKIYILMIALLATCSGSLWAQMPNPFMVGGFSVDTLATPGNAIIVGFASAGNAVIPDQITAPGGTVYVATAIEIGPGAFTNAPFTNVTFAPGTAMTDIPASAFDGSLLRSIVIPPSITTIDTDAFTDCILLRTVTFDPGSNLTTIGDRAFQGSTALTSIDIQANTGGTTIGDDAFNGCTALASATIAQDVTSIGMNAFDGCTNLATVTFDSNPALAIGTSAFANSGLISIELPLGVDDMNSFVANNLIFDGCDKLETVTFETGTALADIPANTFTGSSLANITIPAGVGTFDLSDVSKTLKTVDFEGGNVAITSIPASAFANDSVLVRVTNIPAGVTLIDDFAFLNCIALNSVTFEAGSALTAIGHEVFKSTGLTFFELPATVTALGDSVFAHSSLTSVDFSNIDPTITTLPGGTFKGTALTSFNIPATITVIGEAAFLDAGLTSLRVPATLLTIEEDAFKNNNLPNVVFEDLSLSVSGFTGDSAFANNPLTRIIFEGYALAGTASAGVGTFGGAPLLREIVIQEPDPANLPMFPIADIVGAIDSIVDIVLPSASVTAAYIADPFWGNDTTVIAGNPGNIAYIPVTVTFGGSSGVPSRRVPSVAEGDSVIQPADPARSGYAFLGWYNDVDSVITWPFGVKGDTTVYARWREVYVPGEGGSTAPPTPSVPTSTTLKIAGQPTSATIFIGESHTFEVFLSASSGTVTYLWYKDGQPLTGNLSTYTVEDAETSDAGDYYVVITDATGQLISSVATLTVLATQSNESIDGSSFKAYPNPTTGITNVAGLKVGAVLKVYSATGAQVGVYTATAEEITIDLSHLSNGMYFLNVDGKTVRVIKK